MKFINVLAILVVAIFLFCAVTVQAGGVGTYSTGYRMGEIYKISIKGKMLKSGEGDMLIGVESDVITKKNGGIVDNPWLFSVPSDSKAVLDAIDDHLGEYVVVEYIQYRKKTPNVDTEYEVTAIHPIVNKAPRTCQVGDFKDQWGDGTLGKIDMKTKSKGKRAGRFVKVSKKGTTRKTNEVTVQQGFAGTNFINMSMLDNGMYECAVEMMKSAQKVKLYYIESHIKNGLTRETPYDIIRMDAVNQQKLN